MSQFFLGILKIITAKTLLVLQKCLQDNGLKYLIKRKKLWYEQNLVI